MSFQALSAELQGVLGNLSPFLADSYVTRAQRDVYDARLWSFLQDQGGSIVCPTQVTTGTASITYQSDQVTMDADASAALLTLNATSPLTTLQIRFGGQNNAAFAGQIYNITALDQTTPTAIVLTLDRALAQATNATSGYQCYRCYVTPPVDDFLMFQSVVDMTNGWNLKLNYTSSFFDYKDPQRMAQGLGYYVGAYVGSPEDQSRPRYEIWPHPTSGQTFFVRFRRYGTLFVSPAATQPTIIPDQLIMHRANGWYAYPWAQVNVGRFPALRGVGWIAAILDEKKKYFEALQTAKRADDNLQNNSIISRGHGLRSYNGAYKGMTAFPIDARFVQSHLLNF